MKKNKMTVYSQDKIQKPQEHYERLLRDSDDLLRILCYIGDFGQPLKVFLRLYQSHKYNGACKILINCIENSHLYSIYDIKKLYFYIREVYELVDVALINELNMILKKKGLVLT